MQKRWNKIHKLSNYQLNKINDVLTRFISKFLFLSLVYAAAAVGFQFKPKEIVYEFSSFWL